MKSTSDLKERLEALITQIETDLQNFESNSDIVRATRATIKLFKEEIYRKKEDGPLYTPTQVMEMFGISRPTFQDWCNKGVFEKVSIPGQRKVFVRAESVDKIISNGSKRVVKV